MASIPFDRYIRYDELTQICKDLAAEYPNLVMLDSIGKSHEGRDIWILTITDAATGSAATKPAFWCDGNIHASEVSACSATLMVAWKLLTTDTGRELLKSRAFYLVPRLGPDGAEWALEIPPRIIRSSTRQYPFEDEDPYGLERQDLDGDGRILTMRVRDDNGPWKISEAEPRLMQRREPGETGGTYYRQLPEGVFHNFDGATMKSRRLPQGLDMNRNFPHGWRPEAQQYGAGPFPTSEPEIHACVKAVTDRPNICGAVTFHTYSGVNLRPSAKVADDELAAEDIWTYKKLGEKGASMTGYPAISVFHDFKYHPKEHISGTFDDWMYEHRGVYSWTTEIWSPQRQAGITDFKYIDWFREHPFEDDITLLRWSDSALEGKGYHAWQPFTHPQLGEVEIGGWDAQYAFRNPPPPLLEAEIAPLADWVIWQASCSPKLELTDVTVEGGRVRVRVRNSGWLPTNVTKVAEERNMCRGVMATLERTNDATDSPTWLVSGKLSQDGGQLTGWSHTTAGGFGFQSFDESTDSALFEWVVAPGDYTIKVFHDRAGSFTVNTTVA